MHQSLDWQAARIEQTRKSMEQNESKPGDGTIYPASLNDSEILPLVLPSIIQKKTPQPVTIQKECNHPPYQPLHTAPRSTSLANQLPAKPTNLGTHRKGATLEARRHCKRHDESVSSLFFHTHSHTHPHAKNLPLRQVFTSVTSASDRSPSHPVFGKTSNSQPLPAEETR